MSRRCGGLGGGPGPSAPRDRHGRAGTPEGAPVGLFDPLDVLGPYEVLLVGGLLGGDLGVELVSAEGARDVPSGSGTVSLRAVGPLDPVAADTRDVRTRLLPLVPGVGGLLVLRRTRAHREAHR